MILGSNPTMASRAGRGDRVELLDLPHADLSAALDAGVSAAELGQAPIRRTAAADEVQLHAPVPRPRNVWAVGLAYRDHAEEAASHVQLEETELPALFLEGFVVGHRADVADRAPRDRSGCRRLRRRKSQVAIGFAGTQRVGRRRMGPRSRRDRGERRLGPRRAAGSLLSAACTDVTKARASTPSLRSGRGW